MTTTDTALPPGVTTYYDFGRRTQYAVDGPAGHFLVTRTGPGARWQVWRADSLRTLASRGALADALASARRAAGLTD